MFGYVKPRPGELLVKEYELYKAAYCGLCIEGGRTVSRLTRFLLNDDFVFLCLLRMSVTGVRPSIEKRRCPFKLYKKSVLADNECVTYSCAAFAVLTYEKLLDDIADTKGLKRFLKRMTLPYFKAMSRRASRLYPTLSEIAEKHLKQLSETEGSGDADIDSAARPFAMLVGDFCSDGVEGADKRILYECGYHLGRYIYLIDAFEDCIDDEKKGEYNCLISEFGSAAGVIASSDTIRRTLRDSMNALCRAFALADDSGYSALIYNIARFGSEDAFERVKGKINDRSI